MAYCKSCGAYIPDGHTKCLACGLDQNQEEEKEYASGSAAQEEEERSRESREASRREEEERSRQRQEENRRWAEAERRRRQQRERSYGADRNDEDYTVRGARPKGYQSNRLLAALSYIPALFLLPFIFCSNDRFALYHARQGLILFAVTAAGQILGSAFGLRWIVTLMQIYWIIKGISNANAGKMEPVFVFFYHICNYCADYASKHKTYNNCS